MKAKKLIMISKFIIRAGSSRPKRKSIRLKEYNYSMAGYYFVTVCVKGRQQIFGVVENGKMILNDIGKMIDLWWQKMVRQYENISIDKYTIMPNHIHGIINIVGSDL